MIRPCFFVGIKMTREKAPLAGVRKFKQAQEERRHFGNGDDLQAYPIFMVLQRQDIGTIFPYG